MLGWVCFCVLFVSVMFLVFRRWLVSLDCPFFISPSVFSIVYLLQMLEITIIVTLVFRLIFRNFNGTGTADTSWPGVFPGLSVGHCIVCRFPIYDSYLLPWYLHTFPYIDNHLGGAVIVLCFVSSTIILYERVNNVIFGKQICVSESHGFTWKLFINV